MLHFQKSSFQSPVKESSSIRREDALEAEVPVLWPVAQPGVGPELGCQVLSVVAGCCCQSDITRRRRECLCLYLSDHLLGSPPGLPVSTVSPCRGDTHTAGQLRSGLAVSLWQKINQTHGQVFTLLLNKMLQFKKMFYSCTTPCLVIWD